MRWTGPEPLPQLIGQAWCKTSCRYRAVFLTVIDSQAPNLRAAQGMRLFQDGVEHRGEIARRRIDDPQDLRSRRLLLQRLASLGDEPCIFHRDHRLRREIFEECKLLIREGPEF